MGARELDEIIERHQHYILQDVEGWETMKADLANENLEGACLMDVCLKEANLSGANLSGANLENTTLDPSDEYRRGVILTEPIRGWKQCADGIIVELEIPKGAIVFSINGDKCRTNKAKCVSISEGSVAHSLRDVKFKYKVGKKLEIDKFNLMYNVECASGIHFFKTREEAEAYY